MKTRDYDLQALWKGFTANRQFKAAPRLFVSAKDMHYTTDDGRQVLDGTSGLWCVNAGHCRTQIVDAIKRQLDTMDYSPAFQIGHPGEFRVADLISQLAPGDLDHVFFANSGSEAVDSALKIALAYHRAHTAPTSDSHRRQATPPERSPHRRKSAHWPETKIGSCVR